MCGRCAVVFLFIFLSILCGEDIGPFTSTPITAIAPQCNPPKFVQRRPATVFGGGVYLAVWSDGSGIQGSADAADIYCSRIEPVTGRILDPGGIRICGAVNVQGYPAVAYGNDEFLVVWEDFRNGKDYDIYAARVKPDGTVLDPDGFPVSNVSGTNEARPAVGYGAGHFLVAWNDARRYPVYGIVVARVTADKAILDPGGIIIAMESDAAIQAVKPIDGKWKGDKEWWWDNLNVYYQPSISSKDSSCFLAFNCKGGSSFYSANNIAYCVVNAATGSFNTPKALPKINGLASSSSMPKGWAIAPDFWASNWGATPYLICARIDSLLTASDFLVITDTLSLIPNQVLPSGYAAGKGVSTTFKTSCAWNGTRLILAKDVGYSNSTPFLVTTAIAMARLTDTVAIKHFSDNGLIYVDSARNVSGQYVVNSALTAGPSGECLVVYEKNYKIDSCLIVGRLIRER